MYVAACEYAKEIEIVVRELHGGILGTDTDLDRFVVLVEKSDIFDKVTILDGVWSIF